MSTGQHSAGKARVGLGLVVFLSRILVTFVLPSAVQLMVCARPLAASDKPATPTQRWEEDQPGCTFSQGDDGTYRYGVWSGDYGVVMSVDAQEVQKALRRIEPLFAVSVTIRYRGQSSLEVSPAGISLELVQHYHDVHAALDPGDLATELQNEVDRLAEVTEREVRKHPEKKAEKESELLSQQQSVSEMKDFLRIKMLRPASLDSAHPEARGWLLFSLKSKWAGEWKKQEEFVLRVPVAGRVVEFPFALPPSVGAFVLRRR